MINGTLVLLERYQNAVDHGIVGRPALGEPNGCGAVGAPAMHWVTTEIALTQRVFGSQREYGRSIGA
jgi:hypothetical protein